MSGFKDLKQEAVMIAAIELLHRIHEGQLALYVCVCKGKRHAY